MAKLRIPQTFRCHIMVKGEQCPCDLTLTNTFTYKLATLDRKAEASGKETHELIAENALCPWHARFLTHTRRDIVRMDEVVSLLNRRETEVRKAARHREEVAQEMQRISSRSLAYRPRLGAALISAGIR